MLLEAFYTTWPLWVFLTLLAIALVLEQFVAEDIV
jgi:hypothetical protein